MNHLPVCGDTRHLQQQQQQPQQERVCACVSGNIACREPQALIGCFNWTTSVCFLWFFLCVKHQENWGCRSFKSEVGPDCFAPPLLLPWLQPVCHTYTYVPLFHHILVLTCLLKVWSDPENNFTLISESACAAPEAFRCCPVKHSLYDIKTGMIWFGFFFFFSIWSTKLSCS